MPRSKTKSKPLQQSSFRNSRYGKEVTIQIPIGRHETRSLTLAQARVAYRHLHEIRKIFK